MMHILTSLSTFSGYFEKGCQSNLSNFSALEFKKHKSKLNKKNTNILRGSTGWGGFFTVKNLLILALKCKLLPKIIRSNAFNSSQILEPGVKVSLFNMCHFNIIFDNSYFKKSFRPAYLRELWYYKSADVENIYWSVASVDWDFIFHDKLVRKCKYSMKSRKILFIVIFQIKLSNVTKNIEPEWLR